MLKTNLQIKKTIFTAVFVVFIIPTLVSAGGTGSFGSDSYDYGGWGGNAPTYDYSYTPNYSYTPTYTPSYSGGSNYTPSYYSGDYGYTSGGSSYTPSYSSPSVYTSSSNYSPSYNTNSNKNTNNNKNNNNNNNANTNTNTNNIKNDIKNDVKVDVKNNNNINNNSSANSNSTSSSSATAINNNVNNVYVYTNPTGNAVVYNPQHQYLNVYCVITPSNPRVGQTVTATAYASGGTGNYTYTWGGDIYQTSGPSTSFTSYTTGTKNITVTARSGQEIITKSCDVVFVNENTNNNNNNGLSAVCYANPTNALVNQTITWSVVPNGGNGSYSYNWSGTDGLSGNSQYISRQYGYTGNKSAFVTVYSNGLSVTANCSTNINNVAGVNYTSSSVNLTPNITTGTPVSGVYLSQLPATGLSLGFIEYMIAGMVIVLAIVFTFVYQARKRLIVENI